MHRTERRRRQELQREIPVRHRIQRIGHGPVEPQKVRRHLPVDRKGRARQGRRAKGAFVHPRPRIGKPPGIAAQHLDISHHVMTPCDGLRRLQMGEPRHHPIGPGPGLRQKCALQGLDPCNRRVALVAHPQPEIGRHLVVPRPPRVQPPRRLADHLFQPRLHVHVDVFQRGAELKRSSFDL